MSDVAERSLQGIVQIKGCLASIIDINRSRGYNALINADPDKYLFANDGKKYFAQGCVHVNGIAQHRYTCMFKKQNDL